MQYTLLLYTLDARGSFQDFAVTPTRLSSSRRAALSFSNRGFGSLSRLSGKPSWPPCEDRAIPLPIPWVDDDVYDDSGDNPGSASQASPPANPFEKSFALKKSFAEHPNWVTTSVQLSNPPEYPPRQHDLYFLSARAIIIFILAVSDSQTMRSRQICESFDRPCPLFARVAA